MHPLPEGELVTSFRWLAKDVPLTDGDALETVTYRVTGTISTLTVLFGSRPHPVVPPQYFGDTSEIRRPHRASAPGRLIWLYADVSARYS
jgi:hypothetical protein